MEELSFVQGRFVDDDFNALGLDALHNALDGRRSEVIRAGFHDEAIYADHFRVATDDLVGDEVFARGVGFDDGVNEVLRHIAVVGQQLLGVFGQAVATVAKAGVVVVGADTRVEANAVNDLLAVQAMGGGIGVELVEVRDTHGQVGIGEEFDGFGFGGIGKEDGDVFFDGAFFEQAGKDFGPLGAFADNNARWMQVVVEGTAFAQEFRREDKVLGAEGFAGLHGVADGDGRFDDHGGIRIDGHDVTDHGFNGLGIEVVGFGVVVSGGGDDDVVGPFVSVFFIQRGTEV